jgi:mycothiol system anti-sigma-R factor
MGCELSTTRLHAYLDGELDAAGAAEFERHLEACPDCEIRLNTESQLHNALQQAGLYERAPSSLRAKLQASLPAPAPAAEPQPNKVVSMPRRPTWGWLAAAAALLLAAALGWHQLGAFRNSSYEQTLAAAVVDAHLRSMQPGHLEDVISTDQHTVKPWFDGRVDFAPPVRDLAADGFPLLGGRLDVLDGRTVAALVYGRRKHVINVFVTKSQAAEPWSGSGDLQGYHWLAWQDGDLSFCAVSDVAPPDLTQLRQLIQQR